MTDELQARIDKAVQDADDAFWAVVADAFPEGEAGDYPIDVTCLMWEQQREYITLWLRINAPSLSPALSD